MHNGKNVITINYYQHYYHYYYAALRKAVNTRRDADMLIYKDLRNKVIQELREAKSHFHLNILNEEEGNSKFI